MQKITTAFPQGVVVDIDDTLAESALSCAEAILNEFPDSTSRTARSLIEQYRQPGAVPFWQQSEIQKRIAWYFNNDAFIRSLTVIEGAVEGIKSLTRSEQLAFYITSRPQSLQTVTQEWLEEQGFSQAPVLTRDPLVTDPDWKLQYLVEHFPNMSAIIDDSWQPLVANNPGFKGKMIFFERYGEQLDDVERIHWVQSWQEVEEIIDA